jgi:peptidoglycan-associated lipoprotein
MKLTTPIIFALLAIALVFGLGCSNKKADVDTVPQVAVPPTPTPMPEPVVEEVIEEPETSSIISEEVAEELPDDIMLLNARGYLTDAFFETDRYDLSAETREHLAKNSTWLQDYPTVQVLIEGHCDNRNTRDYNLALGERRANAVRDYLVFLGIPANRVLTISYGEERPFATGNNESAWKLNRRAHFVITAR